VMSLEARWLQAMVTAASHGAPVQTGQFGRCDLVPYGSQWPYGDRCSGPLCTGPGLRIPLLTSLGAVWGVIIADGRVRPVPFHQLLVASRASEGSRVADCHGRTPAMDGCFPPRAPALRLRTSIVPPAVCIRACGPRSDRMMASPIPDRGVLRSRSSFSVTGGVVSIVIVSRDRTSQVRSSRF
jgi:hypothetical protein